MTTTTTRLALKKAQDADVSRTYLTTDLAAALDTIDADNHEGAIPLNVKTYGAVGDGTTDDSTAIQAAINAGGAAGGVVFFPGGPGTTYVVNTQVTWASSLTLLGSGAVIKRGATLSTGALFTKASGLADLTIDGLTFDNRSVAAVLLSFGTGSARVTVRNCRFQAFTDAYVLEFTGSATSHTDTRIERCTFVGNGTLGNYTTVYLIDCDRLRVESNQFRSCGSVKIEAGSSASQPTRDVHVRGNSFQSIPNSAVLVRTNGATSIEDVEISGNVFRSVGQDQGKGAIVAGESTDSNAGATAKRIAIVGNTVKHFGGTDTAGGGHAIAVGHTATVTGVVVANNVIDGSDLSDAAPTGATDGIFVRDNCADVVISGNEIANCGLGGIRITSCSDVSITGNVVSTCCLIDSASFNNESGIYIAASAVGVSVVGNTSRNNGTSTTYPVAGIGIVGSGSASDIVISGNRCYDDRGTQYQSYGVRLGVTGAYPVRVVVVGNQLRGNLTAAIGRFNGAIQKVYMVALNAGDTYEATATWDPASVANGGMTSTTVTATGAVAGDLVACAFTTPVPAGAVLSAAVTANDTVTVTLVNHTGGGLDLASGTLTVSVQKRL